MDIKSHNLNQLVCLLTTSDVSFKFITLVVPTRLVFYGIEYESEKYITVTFQHLAYSRSNSYVKIYYWYKIRDKGIVVLQKVVIKES